MIKIVRCCYATMSTSQFSIRNKKKKIFSIKIQILFNSPKKSVSMDEVDHQQKTKIYIFITKNNKEHLYQSPYTPKSQCIHTHTFL